MVIDASTPEQGGMADKSGVVRRIEMKENIVQNLTSKDDKYACALTDRIVAESHDTDEWYEYFEDVASLLDHPKSLVRNRALHILAANAQWDEENRFDLILPDYLKHITDEKPITARQCVKALAQVGLARPQYIPQILSALRSADLSKYKDSMRPLIERDMEETEKILINSSLTGCLPCQRRRNPMFRPMRRFRQQLSNEECERILAEATSGVLALSGDDGYPYAVPLSHVYQDGKLYFHCAKEGHKLDSIRRNEKVSFCVIAQDEVIPAKRTTAYISVIAFGKAVIVDDESGLRRIAGLIGEKFSGDYPEDCRKETDQMIAADRMYCLEITVEHLTGKCGLEVLRSSS